MTTSEVEFHAFEQAYQAGTAQLVWSELIADLETPGGRLFETGRGAGLFIPARVS